MKRVIASIMVLLAIMTLPGCKIINFFTEYWDGMTKSETMEYVQDALREKYSEEFKVKKLAYRGGSSWDAHPILLANCSPVSDEDIVFEIEVYVLGEGENQRRKMYDNYIQNVVRKQLKKSIDDVLKSNYESFASEVFVTHLDRFYNSGILSVNEATVENFSNSFTDQEANKTMVWIALNIADKEDGTVKLEKILRNMISGFYLLNVYVEIYYTNEETIKLCNEEVSQKNPDHWEVKHILTSGKFPTEYFAYFNDERGLKYRGNKIM
ncbi:MAG: hypothetical protein ACI4JS_01585 [Oscillospiraceae bacterium]